MPELDNGTYQQKVEAKVTYWQSPDKDGDGEEVWSDNFDPNGNSLGRSRVKDNNGEQIYHYEAPEGFVNMPGYEHADNYVRVDSRGRVLRNAAGEAINISEGHALVEYPDGSTKLLTDEYARHLFALANDKVNDDNSANESQEGDENTPRKRPTKATPATVAKNADSGGTAK